MPPIRSWQVIRESMVQDMLGYLTGITYIDERSNIMGLLTPVAKVIQRQEYELDRAKRALDLFTAEGDALDALGQKRGVYRYGPSKASAVVGVYGTGQLNVGDVLQSTGGIRFVAVTQSAVLSGAVRRHINLMSQVQVVAETGGVSGNASAFTITRVVSGTATLSVINVIPATGGEDREGDSAYRERIIRATSFLNHRTEDKYLVVCQAANENVMRVWLGMGTQTNGVLVKVATRSLATLSATELESLRQALLPQVFPDRPQMMAQDFSQFKVLVTAVLNPSYTIQTVHGYLVSNLVNYVNTSSWPYGEYVHDETLLSLCANTTGIHNLDRGNFILKDDSDATISGDVPIGVSQLPQLVEVSLTDQQTGQTYGSGEALSVSYTPRTAPPRPRALD